MFNQGLVKKESVTGIIATVFLLVKFTTCELTTHFLQFATNFTKTHHLVQIVDKSFVL